MQPGKIFSFHIVILIFGLGLASLLWPHPRASLRGPASDIYNDDGELVMSEQSVSELAHERDQGVHLHSTSHILFSERGEELGETEALRRTGHRVRRAREARLNYEAFLEGVRSPSKEVILNLFTDTKLTVVLRPASALRVNQGIYSGVVAGDDGSQVHIYVADGQMSGVVETSRGELYRLIPHVNGLETLAQDK